MKPLIKLLFLFFCIHSTAYSQAFELRPFVKGKVLNAGGSSQIERLIKQQLQLPDTVFLTNKSHVIHYSFSLSNTGIIENVVLVKGSSHLINMEVLRILKKIEWLKPSPEIQNKTLDFLIIIDEKSFQKMIKKRQYQTLNYPVLPVDTTQHIYLFNLVDQKPSPIFTEGNYSSADHFFNSKIKYPEAAIRLGLKGQVEVEFIVEQNGMISNIHVVKPLQGGCSEEAVRVIELLQWNPGVNNGIAVRVKQKAVMNFGSGY